jgi:DNA adenine methylase
VPRALEPRAAAISGDSAAAGLRPPLKWAGGKRWLVPHLAPIWEAHPGRRLVEPFCGGLAVALGLAPDRALLNDRNPHAVNLYRWIAKGLRIDLPMRNNRALFYEHRASFNRLVREGRERSREAAGLFYYLNRTCYNGLCRFNSSGEFNVPFGDYRRIAYVDDFAEYRPVLSRWRFTDGDFEAMRLAKDDFVYADPPYDVEFTRYAREAFGWEDQVRLAEWLADHPGPVLLSNQATDRVVRLYRRTGFRLRFLDAPRRISCNGDRRPAPEVLASRGVPAG